MFLCLFWVDQQAYLGSESLSAGGIKKPYCFVHMLRVNGVKRESVNVAGNNCQHYTKNSEEIDKM